MKREITAEEAQNMLDRDALNQVKALQKGRRLTEKEARSLRKVIRRAKSKNNLPKVARKHIRAPKLNSLEGQYLTRVRRRKVYVMRMQNMTVREMADELRAGQQTIISDLKQIDEALKRDIDSKQGTEILNEKLLELEGLKIMAIAGAKESEGNEQTGFLNTAAKINELQAKLLQDAGIIRKVAAKHELSGPDGAPLPAATPLAAEIIVTTRTEEDEKKLAGRYKVVRLASPEPA